MTETAVSPGRVMSTTERSDVRAPPPAITAFEPLQRSFAVALASGSAITTGADGG